MTLTVQYHTPTQATLQVTLLLPLLGPVLASMFNPKAGAIDDGNSTALHHLGPGDTATTT